MDSILNIDITVTNSGKLVANDTTNYDSDVDQHVSVSFVCYHPYESVDSELTAIITSVLIVDSNPNCVYTYQLPKDGTYDYYKYWVPKLEHYLSNTTYLIENKVFYYNDKFYIGNKACTLDEVLVNSTEITDLADLQNYLSWGITFYAHLKLFTTFQLSKCLVELQKKVIFQTLKCCGTNKTNIDRLNRDFINASLFVINYYVDSESYTEAQRILENITTCNAVCSGDWMNNNINNCNCGTIA